MLAAVLRNTGDNDLEVTDTIQVNDPGPDDVIVEITHTGVCHSDVSAMNGTIPQPAPAVLGHEGAGIIEEVGENVTEVAVGDHVIVVWSPPCGGCKFCIDHSSPNLCMTVQFGSMMIPHFREGDVDVHAMAGAGTFAEKTLLPKQAVVNIDPDIPLDIIEQSRKYRNTRSASCRSWLRDGSGMIIGTRFGETSQLHMLNMPMGSRNQITFFD